MSSCFKSPTPPLCVPSSHSDHQQRQQQDELRRGRAARQSGLPGGGDREGAARHGRLHRQHALRLRKVGGSHPRRGQRQERRHRAGQALLHLRGESWDICETITGKLQNYLPCARNLKHIMMQFLFNIYLLFLILWDVWHFVFLVIWRSLSVWGLMFSSAVSVVPAFFFFCFRLHAQLFWIKTTLLFSPRKYCIASLCVTLTIDYMRQPGEESRIYIPEEGKHNNLFGAVLG